MTDKIDITQEELDDTYNITDKKKETQSETEEFEILIEEEDKKIEEEFLG